MTKCLILAAGQGTRLGQMTADKPKCMVPIFGVPIIQRQAETLKLAGIEDISVATGYKASMVDSLGFFTHYNPNYKNTNMVSSMFVARQLFENNTEDLIISYGDIIYQQKNLKQVLECKSEVCIMVDLEWKKLWDKRFSDPLSDAESMKFDKEHNISELGKKTSNYDDAQGQYTGLIKFRKDILKKVLEYYEKLQNSKTLLKKEIDNMYLTDFIQILIGNRMEVKAVTVRSGWLEIDTFNDIQVYEEMKKNGQINEFFRED